MAAAMTAVELRAALAELAEELREGTVRDVARLRDRDDLLVFLDTPAGGRALHVAPGGARARLTTTRRRFAAAAFQRSPQLDRIRELLAGRRLTGAVQPDGERRCSLRWTRPGEENLLLEVELFGNRGLWCLTTADGTIAALSRLPSSGDSTLRPGARYRPPPPRPRLEEPAPRFTPPVLDAIDAWFTERDLEDEHARARAELDRAGERAARRLAARIDGLTTQRATIADAPAVRRRADLLLSYAHLAPRGGVLVVPDPDAPETELRLELEPGKPIPAQARALYQRARKLEDGAAHCDRELAAARAELDRLSGLRSRWAVGDESAEPELRAELGARGLLPKPRRDRPAAPARPKDKATRGIDLRRATSAEGYPILVGRDNRQNDRLSTAIARGNDLWFHVGGGRAGSHVVVRLPRGKTASLETMLDAATLAVHFSKARGAERCDVDYTLAKFVRKPKGMPPGKVLISQQRSLRVDLDPDRLQRLLASLGES